MAQRIHPQTIAAGWRLARAEARKALEEGAQDHSKDEAQFRQDLLQIASTTLSSKLLTHEKEHFAKLAVDAVLRLKGSNNLEHVQVLKKPGGSIRDSYLEDGFLLNKSVGVGQPHRVENAKILIANTSMDTDKIKIYGSRVKVESLSKVAEIEQAEKVRFGNDCVCLSYFGSYPLSFSFLPGQDEKKVRKDYQSWMQRLYQPPTHLQLPRIHLCREGNYGD